MTAWVNCYRQFWGRDAENDDICLTENEKAGILLVTTNRHAGLHAGN
jgi:hypothetical protein